MLGYCMLTFERLKMITVTQRGVLVPASSLNYGLARDLRAIFVTLDRYSQTLDSTGKVGGSTFTAAINETVPPTGSFRLL